MCMPLQSFALPTELNRDERHGFRTIYILCNPASSAVQLAPVDRILPWVSDPVPGTTQDRVYPDLSWLHDRSMPQSAT